MSIELQYEVKYFEILSVEISTRKSSLNEEREQLSYDEVFSSHESSFKEDLKSEDLSDDLNEEYFLVKTKMSYKEV